MSALVSDLSHYKDFAPTKSCYLDGRYFNQVFASYPGLIREALTIKIIGETYTAKMPKCAVNHNYDGLLRVVIEAEGVRHATLVILDHQTQTGYWFEPFSSSLDGDLAKIIAQYIGYQIVQVPHHAPKVKNANCDRSGFCTAYCIKYAHDYLHDKPFDLTKIKSFSSCVENKYVCGKGKVDKCYGLFDGNRGVGTLIGAGAGALIGGPLLGGGVGGALGGAALGGLGGYALSSPGMPFGGR
jgi:hypothetical protein